MHPPPRTNNDWHPSNLAVLTWRAERSRRDERDVCVGSRAPASGWLGGEGGSDDEHAVSGGSDFCCQDSFEAFMSRHHTSTMVARREKCWCILRICLLGLGVFACAAHQEWKFGNYKATRSKVAGG